MRFGLEQTAHSIERDDEIRPSAEIILCKYSTRIKKESAFNRSLLAAFRFAILSFINMCRVVCV